jgi:hypothetical protein
MSRTLAVFAALIASAAPASAGPLSFLLNPIVQAGVAGGSVVFQGTLQNTAAPDLFLNDLSLTFTPPGGLYLAVDPNFFFFNVPGVLLAGESYIGPVFRVTIAPGTPSATYFGSATILGGDHDVTFNPIGSQGFQVAVGTVPEPATVSLMFAGLAITLAGCRSRRP